MSLADNKRSVFTTIGSYTSMIEQPNLPFQTDLFDSINNKDDIVPFLLDVLKTVAGSDALKETIGGMFTTLVGEMEPKLKTELKKQFTQSNADTELPSSFVTNGISIDVKSIDTNGKLKVNPNSVGGDLIYNKYVPNFDGIAYDAIVNDGFPQDFSVLTLTYNSTLDKMEVKPNITSSMNVSDFFGEYIDDTKLLDEKEIVSSVMDGIYGTLAKNQNKTEEQILEELLVEAQLHQVLDGDDSFEISPAKYDELQTRARELVAGVVNYDMGCGLMAAELQFDDFSNTVSNISGATDPYYVGDQFDETISKSTDDTEVSEENKQTIKDGFFQKIIKIFTVKILLAVTGAPQIRTMLAMMSSLQNEGEVLIDKASDDMSNFKTMIKCMSKEVMAMIAEFIFAIAVTYLIKLLKPIITKVIKEKINQYSDIMISLTGALSKIKDVAGTVTGVIT